MTAARRARRRRWPRVVAAVLLGPLLVLGLVLGLALYLLYRSVAVEVDARLAGLHDRVAPKVYARPFVLRTGQALTSHELDERLDDLGYTRKDQAVAPGEFDVQPTEVRLVPRGGTAEGQVVRVVLSLDAAGRSGQVRSLESARGGKIAEVELEAPLLTAVAAGGRGRQRQLPLAQFPRSYRPCSRSRIDASTRTRVSTSFAPSAPSSPTCAARRSTWSAAAR